MGTLLEPRDPLTLTRDRKSPRECPICHLINTEDAEICDCGHLFTEAERHDAPPTPEVTWRRRLLTGCWGALLATLAGVSALLSLMLFALPLVLMAGFHDWIDQFVAAIFAVRVPLYFLALCGTLGFLGGLWWDRLLTRFISEHEE